MNNLTTDLIFDEVIEVTEETLDNLEVTEEIEPEGGIEDEDN